MKVQSITINKKNKDSNSNKVNICKRIFLVYDYTKRRYLTTRINTMMINKTIDSTTLTC